MASRTEALARLAGAALRAVRRGSGLSRPALADQVGIHPDVLKRAESESTHGPSFALVLNVCKVCGVSLEDFVRLMYGAKGRRSPKSAGVATLRRHLNTALKVLDGLR